MVFAQTFSHAALFLLINLVSSTILELMLRPPAEIDVSELLDELARRMAEWICG